MKKERTIIRKIISIIGIAFLFLIVLEICTRIDDKIKYNAPFFETYKVGRLRSFDEDGIRCNIPNTRYEKWINNKYGFRGVAYDIEKPDSVTRVVCLGTSETYGSFESMGKEWPAQLSDFLNQYGSYQVINASAVGLGMQQYTKYMEKHVFKFNPDIVILFVNPQIELTELIYRPEGMSVSDNQPTKNKKGSSFSLKSIKDNFRIFTKSWQAIKSFVPTWLLELYQYRDRLKKIKHQEEIYLKGNKPMDKIPIKTLESFKFYLENTIVDLKKRGINVILPAFPCLITENNTDQFPLILMEFRRFCIFLSNEGIANASSVGDSLYQEIAQKYQIGFVDCNNLVPKNLTYFGDHVHMYNCGSEIVAKALAEYIVSHYQKN